QNLLARTTVTERDDHKQPPLTDPNPPTPVTLCATKKLSKSACWSIRSLGAQEAHSAPHSAVVASIGPSISAPPHSPWLLKTFEPVRRSFSFQSFAPAWR